MDMSQTLQGCKIEPNHKFYTPTALAASLMDRIDFNDAKVALDPCSGQGAFFRAFPKWLARFECEIDHDKGDFYEWEIPVCWVVSNPPFDNLTKWIEHTCRIAEKGFAYLIPTYALSHNRLKLIESWGFYCKEATIIENPKEWNLGFPMAFYVFEKSSRSTARNIRLNSKPEPVQSTLESF